MKKIMELPEFERPREKIVLKGVQALSSEELIMVILGRGVKGVSINKLAESVLKLIEKNKDSLTIEHLESIKGIGQAKATQILASFELTKRYLLKPEKRISNSEDIVRLVEDIRISKQEHFITITLTGSSTVIEKRTVFKGTIDYSIIHPREIFADALTDRAAGIVFVHNHPTDTSEPSEDDIQITKQLCETAKLLGIKVIDHIIVNKDDYFSFQKKGLLGSCQ
jgi:DNA repair protein RadC